MTEACYFCSGPVNPHDEGVHKQVIGWVGGKKSDGMILREDTGKHACRVCIAKLKLGQSPDQPDLFGSDSGGPSGDIPLQGLQTSGDLDNPGPAE